MVRPPRVGDISRTRAEKLHAAASELLAVVVKMPRACSSIRGRPGTGASSSRRRYRHECSAGCGA
jgi:hypothetical protein